MPVPSGDSIGQELFNFQSALIQGGESLESFVKDNYLQRWLGDNLVHAMKIRTTFVNSMQQYLADQGLLNLERVAMSPVTDPLAHDVEHVPSISYKGNNYVTTHSMIYAKFLACFNRKIKGIFVDSPNIRLEIESPTGKQRKKYAIDFSQMDMELRRNRGVSAEEYLKEPEKVTAILKEDMEKALSFFEGLMIAAMKAICERNEEDLTALGVAINVPESPFPRFTNDELVKKYGAGVYEKEAGTKVDGHFFWVTGLMRENYDLIYPYLKPDGSKIPLSDFTSDMIYNYDLCAQPFDRKKKKYGAAYEILSGALREWVYDAIIDRLIDNKIIAVRPEIVGGNILNINELSGYGPFLLTAYQKSRKGEPLFPETFGGGVGVERTLFALLHGEKIKKVDDVMLFCKNPDSHPLYLF